MVTNMAGNLLRYSGLIAKTRAMNKKLLSKEELNQLTEMSTVNEVILFLKSIAGYEDIYSGRDMEWHRGQAEALIVNSLYRDLRKLYRFTDLIQREVLDIVLLRYEADVLKHYLKCIYQEKREPLESHLDEFFKKHIKLPIEQLKRANSIQEFRQVMRTTSYERVFMKPVQEGKDSYGDYAQKIDIYYYTTVYKEIQKFEQADMRHLLKTIFGIKIDWLNLTWIYRAKRYYRQTPADIYALLIPVSYRLKKEETKKMVQAGDVPEMVKILENTGYFKGKDALVQIEDEISYRKVIEKMYRDVSRKYPSSMAPVLKYIFDKEQEIETVTSIIEGIRYQISPKEIKDLILITV